MRRVIIDSIRIEVATHGKVTSKAMRLYCENRISKKVFYEQIKKGLEQYEKNLQH